ncbi:hypothetical protein [Burkholderia anthina]|nr:hypothetical protein [Burkholderia anthina]
MGALEHFVKPRDEIQQPIAVEIAECGSSRISEQRTCGLAPRPIVE